MCIYYMGREGLTYSSEEHIIPAGLGGRRTLPKGYVSDQFNNEISKIEQSFMREGIFAIPRTIIGPGKKGKLGERNATKSGVHLITSSEDEHLFALGYTKLGVIKEIPHVRLDLSSGIASVNFDKSIISSGEEAIEAFKIKFSTSILKIKQVENEEIPEDLVLVGIEENIEEKKNCFVFKNPNCKLILTEEKIRTVIASLDFKGKAPESKSYLPTAHDTVCFKEDYLRVYAKIAFNFLASVIGNVAIKQDCFDPVRNWIANDGKNKCAEICQNITEPLTSLKISLPEDSHYIKVDRIGNLVVANVLLYNHFGVKIILSDNYDGAFSDDGLICDWRNQREYKWSEFMARSFKLN